MALQPEVRDLTMPEVGTAHNVAVVSIDRRYEGQAVKVAQSLWGAGQMMFNKYLLVVPSGTDVRDSDALARLLRRIDPVRDLVRSEGILDVLDHATATPGFGGKIAIDATTAGACAEPRVSVGIRTATLSAGGLPHRSARKVGRGACLRGTGGRGSNP